MRSEDASDVEGRSELWLDARFDAEADFLTTRYGLSPETAISRTHDALVVNEIRSLARERSDVVDSWTTHYEEFLEVAFVVSPGSERSVASFVESLIEEFGLPDVRVSTTAAPLSKEEIETAREELGKLLRESDLGSWSMYTSPRTGEIHLEVGADRSDATQVGEALIDAVVAADPRRAGGFAPVVVSVEENAALAGGGERMDLDGRRCSSGFAVRDAQGPAILTAGHCRNTSVTLTDSSGAGNQGNVTVALGNALNDGYANNGRDRQFHRLPSSAVGDPAVRTETNGARQVITRVQVANPGNIICQFGQRTNARQCGVVTAIDQDSTGTDGVTLSGMVHTDANMMFGDSGGPAFIGDQAVGLMSRGRNCTVAAVPGDTCPSDAFRDSTLQPIGTALGGTGFTLLGAGDTGRFEAISNPVRVFDSRTQCCRVGAGSSRTVAVRGSGGVPDHPNVSAVVLSVTTINPSGAGWLQVYPNGVQRPGLASSGNYSAGSVTTHHITVPLNSVSNAVRIWSHQATDVTVDVLGYYRHDVNTARINLLNTPQRALDTRNSYGAPWPIAPAQTRNVTLPSSVPSNAHAVLVNVTAINPTQQTYLTAHSPATARPGISHLNASAGVVTSNLVTSRVRSISTSAGARAQMALYNHAGSTNVTVDVLGWYAATGDLVVPIPATRVHDTRSGTAIGAGEARIIQVRGSVGAQATIPTNATGVLLRVTAMQSTGGGFVTVTRDGTSTTSTLGKRVGVAVSNAVVVPTSGSTIRVYNSAGTTHVTVDVEGYVYDG